MFDLSWLDHLTHLRYLHIKAFRHTSLATLQSLGLLQPAPPLPFPSPLGLLYPPHLPDFVGRVEELGLDLFDRKVGLSRASELTFESWTRLQRCAVHFMTLAGPMVSSFDVERLHISPACQAANVILRERVGDTKWVTEEQLISGRWDSRWKRKMASNL